MGISDDVVKKFDESQKKLYFDAIEIYAQKEAEIVYEVNKIEEKLKDNNQIPNINVSLNNKMVEMTHQFDDSGLSMFSKKVENYGKYKQNYITSSIVGQSVLEEIFTQEKNGLIKLKEYSKQMNQIFNTKENNEKNKPAIIETKNPIKKLFNKIKSIFTPKRQEEPGQIEQTKAEREKARTTLEEYKEQDNKLSKYNLKENVAESIAKYVQKEKYEPTVVPDLLRKSIMPELKQLGLEDQEEKVEQEIIKQYQKTIPEDTPFYKYSEEEKKKYIPDFSKIENVTHKQIAQEEPKIENKKTIEKDEER